MSERIDLDFDELIDTLKAAMGKDKDFEDLVKLKSDLNREIFIGDIYDGIGKAVDQLICFWNKCDDEKNLSVDERKPIILTIDSCGGSLLDAFTIIDAINLSKTPVYAYVIGAAFSAGFLIAIACHKRYGYKHSSYLFHEGSIETGGTSGQFQNQAEFYKNKRLRWIKDHVLECTKIEEEEYDKNRREDIWYDAYEALEKGIIDEIIGEN